MTDTQQPIEIESTQVDREASIDDRTFFLPNGNKAIIGIHDWDFFQKLRDLPATTKINMMQLSDLEMQEYIDKKINSANTFLLELLKKKWYWRESGDQAFITEETLEFAISIKLSPSQIIKKCKSKNKLPLADIYKVIEFYTKDGSDVFTKEANQ